MERKFEYFVNSIWFILGTFLFPNFVPLLGYGLKGKWIPVTEYMTKAYEMKNYFALFYLNFFVVMGIISSVLALYNVLHIIRYNAGEN